MAFSLQPLIKLWFTTFLYFHLIHKCGKADEHDFICVEKTVRNRMFQLNCTVITLTANVDFKYPKKTFGFAFCIAPTSLTQKTNPDCYCECTSSPTCQCSISQDIDTKTTTLVIRDEELTKMSGTYTCQHGSYSKSINVEKSEILSNVKAVEKKSVVEHDTNTFRSYLGWILFVLVSSYHIYTNKSIGNLYRRISRRGNQSECMTKYDSTAFFQPDRYAVRIVGITFLDNGMLVALDGGNFKIIVFESKRNKWESDRAALMEEPRAITTTTNNIIAVTFPVAQLIRIYDIVLPTENHTVELINHKCISMNELNLPKCKPFSIAHNQNCFAVEVGEREDGKIIILDYNQVIILYTIDCTFAYSTGHTIRLALDTNDGLLYVSAIGRGMVSCVNFNGKLVWNTANSSPRSIIILDDPHFNKIIILSSRRHNAIYELNRHNGKSELVLNTGVNCPRYMAYNRNTNITCIHVKNKLKDELVFYEFKSKV